MASLKIRRFLGSRWFYYFITGVFLVVFDWKILPFLIEKGLINVDIGYDLFSEIFGLLFTLLVLIGIFELREQLHWRKVKEKVLGRIGMQVRALFIQVTHLVNFTWSTFPYEILKELNNKEKLEFSDEGKKILVSDNLVGFIGNLILVLGQLEERYYRFLEAEHELSLMEIQKLLESFRYKIEQYRDPSTREYVAEEFQKKELLENIHAIIREIYKIHESGLDFWVSSI